MCKIRMIRTEPGLISITIDKAVYCENCGEVSNSAWGRCGLCGAQNIVELAPLLIVPPDPDLPPSPAQTVFAGFAA